MQKLFSWPINPHVIAQGWGTQKPELYAQFGFSRHNGLDHAFRDGGLFVPTKNIYAPCDATVVRSDFQPEGGGIFIGLLTDPIAFEAFTCTTPDGVSVPFRAGTFPVLIDFLHLKKSLVASGTKVKRGDLIAIGDNTGFSTGAHCHTQWRRVLPLQGEPRTSQWYDEADKNDANNSFDPTQFFDSFYANDAPVLIRLFQQLPPILWQLLKLKKAA